MITGGIIKIAIILPLFYCCSPSYLDVRPDKQMRIPNTIEDCAALLNDFSTMNTRYPSIGEAAADNHYLTETRFNAQDVPERDNYCWIPQAKHKVNEWYYPYRVVFNANMVLDVLASVSPTEVEYDAVKGTALFFRAYALFNVAQVFAPPYTEGTNGDGWGIPLRLDPAVDTPSERSDLVDTYGQIVADLNLAASLLPEHVAVKSLPCKAAAYAMLARVYLAMENYSDARHFADMALALQSDLMDFNHLSRTSRTPIPRFNEEVIFHSLLQSNPIFSTSNCLVDSNLMKSYHGDDLRQYVFFQENLNGTYTFKGSYDGTFTSIVFNGLTTNELYLINAECLARLGEVSEALGNLETLLASRWDASRPLPQFTAENDLELLQIILTERRKELVFRGQRWTDLRRLNADPNWARVLQRNIGGTRYELPPGDLRYTLLIPDDVINRTSLVQNPR